MELKVKKIKPDIKPILQQFKDGFCFICGESCKSYAHYDCCIAYDDEKEKRIREFYESTGN